MRPFDKAFVEDMRSKLATLDDDAEPSWGSMRPPQMYAHLSTAIKYSLGEEEETPMESGFVGHWIFRPLFITFGMPFPKNIDAPKMYDAAAPQATLDELMEVAERFQSKYEANDLPGLAHPVFGKLTNDEWAKLHVGHFNHHMGQFGMSVN